jgi:hypothetical protein
VGRSLHLHSPTLPLPRLPRLPRLVDSLVSLSISSPSTFHHLPILISTPRFGLDLRTPPQLLPSYTPIYPLPSPIPFPLPDQYPSLPLSSIACHFRSLVSCCSSRYEIIAALLVTKPSPARGNSGSLRWTVESSTQDALDLTPHPLSRCLSVSPSRRLAPSLTRAERGAESVTSLSNLSEKDVASELGRLISSQTPGSA